MELAAARVDLVSALEQKGDDRQILRLLADVQLRLGDGDGAAATAERLERAGTPASDLVLIRAEAALLRGHPDEALALLGNAASPTAERVRAAALADKQDATGALAALRRGAAAGADALLLRDYARFLIGSGDLDGATSQIAALSRLQPDGFDALMLGADVASRRGRYADAHALLERAAARYPGVPDPLIARATVFDLEGKLDDAVAATKRAAAIAPDDVRVRDLNVQFAAMKGDWNTVRTILAKQERDLDPLSANGLSYAEAMLRTGHPEQARALFQRALTRSPNNPFSRIMLAEAQLETGDARAAYTTVYPLANSMMADQRELELAAKAAEAAGLPEAGKFKARLADARQIAAQKLVAQGQSATAREDWATAAAAYAQLAQLGEDAEVLKRLAYALSHQGKVDEAISAADRARSLRPEDPDTSYMAGLVRARAGRDIPAAVALLRQAAQADPGNPVFRQTLARYQPRQGA
ncbi:Tfp pilus assembly protein PilF [Novosphingobium taihuense]|nr:Tfp pilus assembly protein PilF [Novosphingobium taihuense]